MSETWRVAWRLIRFLNPFLGWVSLSALLGFAAVAGGVGLMGASAYIIATAALHPSIAVLQVAIVGVRFFGLSRGVFRYLERLASHEVTFRLLAQLRTWFYNALEPLAPAGLFSFRSGDLAARLVGDINRLEDFYVRGLAPPLSALLVSGALLLFLGSFEGTLVLPALVFLLLQGLILPVGVAYLSRQAGLREVQARGELNAALVDGLQGMEDLLLSGQAPRQLNQVGEASAKVSAAQKRLAAVNALQAGLGVLFSNLGMYAVLIAGIFAVQAGRMDGVTLAVVCLAILASFEAGLPLPGAAQRIEGSLQSARRLFEIAARPAPVLEEGLQPALPVPESPTLEFARLNFRYPADSGEISSERGAERQDSSAGSRPRRPAGVSSQPLSTGFALQDISFRLAPGQRKAIVGPVGSGKSTLANLLLRFWEYGVEGGQILLDGIDLRRFPADAVRAKISWVSPRVDLFPATIRQNLLIARPSATQDEMIAAARLAQIDELIASLPDGYDTWVGEHGLRLSAGERQRLALGRAFLKDAPILLMDEATANLDPLTEERVIQGAIARQQGRSLLLITHRLVGMAQMDEILVLQDGRIAERGHHAKLLAQNGLYARLWDLQASFLAGQSAERREARYNLAL